MTSLYADGFTNTKSSQNFYTPSQLIQAYNLNTISIPQNRPLGYGTKIAIITIYHYSQLQNDLNKFCKKYNLIPITLNIINQAGNISNANWSIRSNMATQIINTISPGCTLYVIEARSDNFSDIKTAIMTAINIGVKIVSMGFGVDEFNTQSSYEHLFMNSMVLFVCPSGNVGCSYPGTSSNVVSVGGTTLLLDESNNVISETVWSQSGGGTSSYTHTPSFQSYVNTTNKRNAPDICMLADPDKSFSVYSSINGGYLTCGGTSLSCHIVSAVFSIAQQLRKSINKPLLNSITTSNLNIQTMLYKLIYNNQENYEDSIRDISGNGYTILSGIGSLKPDRLCNQLKNF
jgi:hypothetical protein